VKVNQAFRYELKPNVSQRILLAKHAGTARFTYNWGLAQRIKLFETSEGKERFTSAIAQHKVLNSLKATEFPWMYEVSKCAAQEALRNLDRAFKNFWSGRKVGRNVGFPKFKKKGMHDSFRLTGSIRVNSHSIQLPRLGKILTKEACGKFTGRILSATISREAERWNVSLSVEVERPDPPTVQGDAVGIDLGLTSFAAMSDGTSYDAPKPLRKAAQRLKRRSRQHSRKLKGSSNRRSSAVKLARLHRRVKNKRWDFLHKLSTQLAKTKSVIVIEDLHIRGMIRNRSLSTAIADAGWGEFRVMLAYKTQWYGSKLVVAPRFFASSKTCSECKHRVDCLPLHIRQWRCPCCGTQHDRDLNAAQNLLKWFLENTASSAGIYACGDPSTGDDTDVSSRHGSLKQESTTRHLSIS
jgi:putative transposase